MFGTDKKMQAGIIVWRFITKLDPLQYTPIYSGYDFYKENDFIYPVAVSISRLQKDY